MTELYYRDAQKMAQKEYRACVAKGVHPYLPALDEIVPSERFANGEELGVVYVPAELIVGTKSRGRTNAFARNFMPLLSESTEFADKWSRLCMAHLEEGIRDPIKVYEYMNRYYVEEGNKRVSVLKFFDAVTIAARVIRIMPEQKEGTEVELYLEYVEFYRYSLINYLEFSKKGSYAALQQLVGKAPGERWTEEERKNFSTAYYYFRRAYEANGGKQLPTTVGDALLAYLKVYGYQDLCTKNEAEIKQSVAKVWEEITLQKEQTPITVKLTPEEESKKGLLAKMLSGSEPKLLKVAFVHDKDPVTSGWVRGHELGRQHVQRVLDGRIITTAYCNAMEKGAGETIEKAIADGNTVIFTTSPRLLPASLRAAVDHTDRMILNCSLNKPHRYIRTYYARMYEVKFIIGAIAGALAGSDHVGYICNYPIYGQVAGINAFALGVQLVNPVAKVFLEWSAVGGEAAATKRLTDRGIRLISSQDMAKLESEENTSYGLSLVTESGQVNLAMPVWQWGSYYEAILRRIQNKSFQAEYQESSKALNYYWGLSAGVVDLKCSDAVPDSTVKLAEFLKRGICSGICEPFYGPLYAQRGHMIEGERPAALSMEQIIAMDWLADNISGSIPDYQDLNEIGKATVDMVGIDRLLREKQNLENSPGGGGTAQSGTDQTGT